MATLTIGEALNRAAQYQAAGNLQAAEQLCRQILQTLPNQADALHLYGIIAAMTGRHEEAVRSIAQAVAQQPNNPVFHGNLGIAYQALGKLPEAARSFQEAIRLDGGFVDAHRNLGNVLLDLGRLQDAEASLRQALRLRPDCGETWNALGIVLKQQKRLEEAVTAYQQATRYQPQLAAAQTNLGNAQLELQRFDEAIASCQQAVRLGPNLAEAHANLGIALTARGRLEEAAASCRQAVLLKPELPEAHCNLGNALRKLKQLDEAAASLEQALRLRPNYADAHLFLSDVLWQQGNAEEAATRCEQVLRLRPEDPGAHFGLGVARLALGQFKEGWPEYEWRRSSPDYQSNVHRQPLWKGEKLAGRTILLHAEQGLGDTLHFIRYAPLVKERGGTVLVECQEALIRLLSSCQGIDRLLAQGAAFAPFDLQAPLLSLPAIFKTNLDNLPKNVPYLHADEQRVQYWRERIGGMGGFKIGIAWQGRPTHAGDRERSFPLSFFGSLAALPGVQLVSLQKSPGNEQLRETVNRFPVIDLGSDALPDFMETAAVVRNLDLVVTADTALAHLAGAIGVPVWVALPYAADWRWLRDREDSPWYPTMRLFRQPALGDWQSVFDRIAEEGIRLLSRR